MPLSVWLSTVRGHLGYMFASAVLYLAVARGLSQVHVTGCTSCQGPLLRLFPHVSHLLLS